MKRIYCLIILSTVTVLIMTNIPNPIFAEPTVSISPSCGPSSPGFNIQVMGNGFAPSSTVGYKLVDSQYKILLYGYFETNSVGGFNDVTFADDLPDGNYKIFFADDVNNDNVFDIGATRVTANLTIPCPGGDIPLTASSPAPQIQWLDVCKSIEWGLVNTCDSYVTSDGSLTQEGERAKNCISNGALISSVGGIGFQLPIPVIIEALEPAAQLTGCDNVVDFTKLKQSTDPESLLRVLGVR